MAGKIELKAPLDGVVTIEPEDTASNFTVTIPAVTSTLVNEDSDIEAQVKTATNASGSAPIYACRAWVNFDGTTTPPTIRASGNVSSVTRSSTGIFVINFTTDISDTNYSVVVGALQGTTDGTIRQDTGAKQINSYTAQWRTAGNLFNPTLADVAIFR